MYKLRQINIRQISSVFVFVQTKNLHKSFFKRMVSQGVAFIEKH